MNIENTPYILCLPPALTDCPQFWRNFVDSIPYDGDNLHDRVIISLQRHGATFINTEEVEKLNTSDVYKILFKTEEDFVAFRLRFS